MKIEDESVLSKAILCHFLHEVYSNKRVQRAVCRSLPDEAMDIKSGYNFDNLADRKRCWESVTKDEPLLAIGSPPCTMCSSLQELNKFMHRSSDVWMQKFQIGMEQAKRYVRFCTPGCQN